MGHQRRKLADCLYRITLISFARSSPQLMLKMKARMHPKQRRRTPKGLYKTKLISFTQKSSKLMLKMKARIHQLDAGKQRRRVAEDLFRMLQIGTTQSSP